MRKKICKALEILLVSLCCFLVYFIVTFFFDYLFGEEFNLKKTLFNSASFALLWAFISGYKIYKTGHYFKRRSREEK